MDVIRAVPAERRDVNDNVAINSLSRQVSPSACASSFNEDHILQLTSKDLRIKSNTIT